MAKKERWASRFGLVLAMAGNAVGLGNFLRFPAQAVRNGGGAFLIPYLVALVVVGLPLIWVEWAMGRHGGHQGHHSAPGIFQSLGRNRGWKYAGVLGLWSCLVIAAFYLYIESWCLAYAGWSLWGGFTGASATPPPEFFGTLTGEVTDGSPKRLFAISPWGMLIFAVCICINVYILSRGLARGIELVCKVGMPLLIVFAALLAIRGLTLQPGVDPKVEHSPLEGLNFVWQPKYESLLDPSVWLAAAGQIFFTLSIGMGTIHCYASYVRESEDIALTGQTAAWTNEFCEVVLGSAILIPIAVAYLGLEAVKQEGGFGLGFMVFPTLFNNWGPVLSRVAGFMWFGLLFFAAITSSLAMGQPIMAFLQAEYGQSREKSALSFGAILLVLAVPVAIFTGKTFFDEFDYWAGTFGLVVFAVLESILFGWVFGINRGWDEIMRGAEVTVPVFFRHVIQYVTPVFLLVILAAYVFKPAPDWRPFLEKKFAGETVAWEWADDGMIGLLLHNDIRTELQKVDGNAKLSAEEREQWTTYWTQVRMVRNFDRLLMVGVFAFLSLLVYVAWQRRAASGITPGAYTPGSPENTMGG